ncbi:MAG: outer membrane protein assembly factor BamC [Succinivibrionaceae bacterium]
MKSLPLILAAGCALSGCNFYLADILHDTPKRANNGFNYLSSDPDRKQFAVDPSKNNFNINDKYYIKDENKNPDDAIIGRQMDISSPVQLSSPFEGAVASTYDNHAVLTISLMDNPDRSLDNILWDELFTYLAKRGIAVDQVDAMNHSVNTGWYTVDYQFNAVTPKMQAENDDLVEYRAKYNVSIKKNDTGTAVVLDVALTNLKAYHDGRRIYLDTNSFIFRRFASLFMNNFTATIGASRPAYASDQSVYLDTSYHTVKLGRDKNNQYAWIISGTYESIWPKFVKMLPQYGFEVLLAEKLKGSIDTDYDEPDENFFSELGIDGFVIDDDKYTFQIGMLGKDQVAITIFNYNDKQPLSDELFLKMYSGFAQALEKELN